MRLRLVPLLVILLLVSGVMGGAGQTAFAQNVGDYNIFEDQQLAHVGLIPQIKEGFGGKASKRAAVEFFGTRRSRVS